MPQEQTREIVPALMRDMSLVTDSGLFDAAYYLRENPDVAASAYDPLLHFVEHGDAEGRDPCQAFSGHYYLAANEGLVHGRDKPLLHYLLVGRDAGSRAAPVASPAIRAAGEGDGVVVQSEMQLIAESGLFDAAFYLEDNHDVAASGMIPLLHFAKFGAYEGRDPGPSFNTSYYLSSNGGLELGRRSAFVHYLQLGRYQELRTAPAYNSKTLNCPFGRGGLPPAIPLHFALDEHLAAYPTINVLLPALQMGKMSGGPNTALNLVFRLAQSGFAIRVIATDLPVDVDLGPLRKHIRNLADSDTWPPVLELVDGSDRGVATKIGVNDIFLATAWWTAQMARWANFLIGDKPIIYLIQDFEPILYPASSEYALAEETYSFDHIPIINSELLATYLVSSQVGCFSNPEHVRDMLVFQPSLDREMFSYAPKTDDQRRRLLFYARPTLGVRNLFATGLAAIRAAIAEELLDPEEWNFVGMGEQFPPHELGRGAWLECAPWLGFSDYARQLRSSDVLLSLMMSPHPSYPPLEMASCGGVVVTNTYANKTATTMARISENILAVDPSVSSIARALGDARARLVDGAARERAARMGLPGSWSESFEAVLAPLTQRLIAHGVSPDVRSRPPQGEPKRLQMPAAATGSSYARFLEGAARRRSLHTAAQPEPGLLSFVSTVWNTAPAYLEVLARSVREQQGGTNFEWCVLDNGSTRSDTLEFLKELAKEPYVRLERVERNLGIIGGMHHVTEYASGRYIIPLDSDDYLYPDCVRTLTWWIRKNEYPSILYTDEDKLRGATLSEPYMKPDWDPVLFSNSCYIAHLCVIDRERALQLGAYSDPSTEASHDWDTFTRFYKAGHTPVHVPEVLYSWRVHPGSTAGDIDSKSAVYQSHKAVLGRFLSGLPNAERFKVEKSSLFGFTPDWRLRRTREVRPRPMTTLRIGSPLTSGSPKLKVPPGVDHEIIELSAGTAIADLVPHVQRCAVEGRLVHLLASEALPDDDEWVFEATGWFELYPGTAVVGGRVHSHSTVIEAGRFRGFGDGFACPDRGRPMNDPGYFAQMWKPHSVGAVSAMHAVFDPWFLDDVLRAIGAEEASVHNLGGWAGVIAAERKRRVIYTPFLSAETTIDWDSLVKPDERMRLNARSAQLGPDRSLRSPNLGRGSGEAYTPVTRSHVQAVSIPSYADWFDRHLKNRGSPHKVDITFSVLTTLYINTDAGLFEQTARSILAQHHSAFEWVVLTHGPIRDDLNGVLARVGLDERVRRFSMDINLGIIGGMRYVLERARNEYVVPMDGDDLLTPDALQLLARAIADATERPTYVYSDEDLYIDERPVAPYLRPSWDPVLDLENSWIWHLTAFRRQAALDSGVYSDPQSEFCHDWDTLFRLSSRDDEPVHLPAVIYHWRQHAASTSNSGAVNDGSSRSARHVLSRKIEHHGLQERYEVKPFPVWRGADEWWIARRPEAPLPAVLELLWDPTPSFWQRAIDTVEGASPGALVLLRARDSDPPQRLAREEAVKLLDFLPKVDAVGGRVLHQGCVVSAGLFVDENGSLTGGYEGMRADDPGAFGLALKPQTAMAPTPDLCYVRLEVIRDALASRPKHLIPSEFGLWLGVVAKRNGTRIAFSPLVETSSRSGLRLWRYDPVATPIAWSALRATIGASGDPDRRGSSGFYSGRVHLSSTEASQ